MVDEYVLPQFRHNGFSLYKSMEFCLFSNENVIVFSEGLN